MRLIRYLIAVVLLPGVISNVAAQNTVETKLMITPHEARLEPGQGLQFKALLFDGRGTPIRIDQISWSIVPDTLGTISADGFFIAGRRDGEVKIIAKAQAGPSTYVADAHIVIGKLPILPVRIIVDPGEAIVPPLGTQQFKAVIVTANGRPEPALRVKWELLPNSLGKIDPNTGLFAAGPGIGFGAVVAFVEVNGAVFRGEAHVIVASATASLAGNVKDQKTGKAIVKAVVWADFIGPFRFARRVETDSLGNYALEKLIPGLYVVRAEARNYLPEFYKDAGIFEQSTPVRLAENEAKKGIDFGLSPGATISGLVSRENDNAPIAGVHVAAILVVRPDLKHNAVTDEKGNYTIHSLPPGTYAVVAEAAGYKGEFYKEKRDLFSADHITLQEEQTVGEVNFTLATGAAISGKVVDAVSKEPIAKALVTIHVLNNSSDKPRVLFNVSTNERGEYIASVPPGFYIVSAEARGFHKEFFEEMRDFKAGKPVQVFADKHTTDINFTMDKLASVTGVVTDAATGKPIVGAIVTAFQEHSTREALINKDELRLPFIAKTDSMGKYKLEGLRAGKYFVQAVARGYLLEFWKETVALKDATPVEVPESGNVENINFTLGPGGAIAGSVLSAADQKPIAGAVVQVFPKDGNAPLARVQAGRDGKYHLDGLLTGEYLVFASAEGFAGLYYKDVERRDQATPVKVEAPNETVDINFQLKPAGPQRGGTVAGAVISELEKTPIPHAFVLLIPLSTASNVPPQPLFAMADDFGRYKISGVPIGKYAAVACAPRYLCEFFENAKSFRDAKIFGVENNVVDNVNFTLAPAQRGPYQIAGRVRHKNQSRGAENVVVQALDNGVIIATALTGNDGSFILDEIPAGEFKISATSATGDAEQQVPVSVNNGRNVTNIELILGTTSVQEASAAVPAKFDLEQNYPNPFNPETSLKYHLPVRTNVSLRIYNALGQEIRTLVNQVQDAGVYSEKWDGKDNNGRQLSTGLYLFRLEAGDFVMTRKMAMVK